jgi:hypothetical protein
LKDCVSSRLCRLDGLHSISHRVRARCFEEFLGLVHVSNDDSILDVGGSLDFWRNSGLESQATILNIALPVHQPATFRWVEGDARSMGMFSDREFDTVF